MATDTDSQVLMEFRAAALEMKKKLDFVNTTKEYRVQQLNGFVAPYLARLRALGWGQVERMITLVRIWDEIKIPGDVGYQKNHTVQ